MTTIQIDIACNGDECGECTRLRDYRKERVLSPTIGIPDFCCDLFMVVLSDGRPKRCPACLVAERRSKGEK